MPSLVQRPNSPGTKQGFLLPEGVKENGGPLIDAIRDRHFVLAHSILDNEPSRAQTEVGQYGLTPLHWCSYQGRVIPLGLVKRVLSLNPKAVYKVDAKRRLPLHYAFCNSAGTAREEIVSLLLTHYPYGATMADETGTKPLQYALNSREDLSMLQLLAVSTFSSGLHGTKPSFANNVYSDWNDLLRLLKSNPVVAEERDKYQLLPVQYACVQGAHLPLLKLLFDVAPQTICTTDLRGRMPLHLVAGVGAADFEIVQYVVSLDESVATIPDADGLAPLHHALIRKAPLDITWLLLTKHLALVQQPAVVEMLLSQYPIEDLAKRVATFLTGEMKLQAARLDEAINSCSQWIIDTQSTGSDGAVRVQPPRAQALSSGDSNVSRPTSASTRPRSSQATAVSPTKRLQKNASSYIATPISPSNRKQRKSFSYVAAPVSPTKRMQRNTSSYVSSTTELEDTDDDVVLDDDIRFSTLIPDDVLSTDTSTRYLLKTLATFRGPVSEAFIPSFLRALPLINFFHHLEVFLMGGTASHLSGAKNLPLSGRDRLSSNKDGESSSRDDGSRPSEQVHVWTQEFVRAFVQPALNITRDFLSREVNIDARSHPQLIQIVYSCLDLAFQHRLERASTVMVEDEKPYKFRYITKLTGRLRKGVALSVKSQSAELSKYASTLAITVRARAGVNIKQCSNSLIEIYPQAATARHLLMEFLDKLAVKCEAEECIVPPLKSMFRSFEKVWVKPEMTRGHFDELLDIARGALVFHEIRDIMKALSEMEASSDVEVVKVRQRVSKIEEDPLSGPTSEGWRDVVVNVVFAEDINRHIAEIQLCYAPLRCGGEDAADDNSKLSGMPSLVQDLAKCSLNFDWLSVRTGPYAWLRTAREQISAIQREDLAVVSANVVAEALDAAVVVRTADHRFPVIFSESNSSPRRRLKQALNLDVIIDSMGMAPEDDGGLWRSMVQNIFEDDNLTHSTRMDITKKIFELSVIGRASSFIQDIEHEARMNVFAKLCDFHMQGKTNIAETEAEDLQKTTPTAVDTDTDVLVSSTSPDQEVAQEENEESVKAIDGGCDDSQASDPTVTADSTDTRAAEQQETAPVDVAPKQTSSSSTGKESAKDFGKGNLFLTPQVDQTTVRF